MSLATLGGIPFQIDPYSVAWDCSLKVLRKKTVGGYVVQVLGTHVGDMTVSGVFAYGSQPNDGLAWQEQERFRARIRDWAENANHDINSTIVFSYPSRNWHFEVYVKEFTSNQGQAVVHDNRIISPDWTVKLFIVQDKTRVVVKAISDMYITRLFDGVGWKQTEYNGPVTNEEAKAFIAAHGGDVTASLRNAFTDASEGNPGGQPQGGAATPAPTTSGGPTAPVPPIPGGSSPGLTQPNDGSIPHGQTK